MKINTMWKIYLFFWFDCGKIKYLTFINFNFFIIILNCHLRSLNKYFLNNSLPHICHLINNSQVTPILHWALCSRLVMLSQALLLPFFQEVIMPWLNLVALNCNPVDITTGSPIVVCLPPKWRMLQKTHSGLSSS